MTNKNLAKFAKLNRLKQSLFAEQEQKKLRDSIEQAIVQDMQEDSELRDLLLESTKVVFNRYKKRILNKREYNNKIALRRDSVAFYQELVDKNPDNPYLLEQLNQAKIKLQRCKKEKF